MLSRPEAGVRNGTLIVTLPGSTGGVRDGIQASHIRWTLYSLLFSILREYR